MRKKYTEVPMTAVDHNHASHSRIANLFADVKGKCCVGDRFAVDWKDLGCHSHGSRSGQGWCLWVESWQERSRNLFLLGVGGWMGLVLLIL